jgi:hypothetical protein
MSSDRKLASTPPDPVDLIQHSLARHDAKAKGLQRARLYFAVAAAFVGPAAVALLATQVVRFEGESQTRTGQVIAVSLVLAESGLLLVALLFGFLEFGGPHTEWIHHRLRAELLRREEFLLCARVGPYLGEGDASLRDRVRERLVSIDSEINNPLDLIAMKDGYRCWRDALEDEWSAGRLSTIPALSAASQKYLEHRIAHQREYFSRKSLFHHRASERLEGAAKLILTLAFVLSVMHLMSVLLVRTAASRQSLPFQILLILAIFLPSLGAMFAGLQYIQGSDRLSRSYLYHAALLEDFESRLRKLQKKMTLDSSEKKDAQLRFMRLVLEVEEYLSHESRFWWLVMYPSMPKASP